MQWRVGGSSFVTTVPRFRYRFCYPYNSVYYRTKTPEYMSSRIGDGIPYRVAKHIYNSVLRTNLPRKFGVFNGVVARDIRLFDRTDYFPDYKSGLVDAAADYVSDGDHTVEVGTGRGVLTSHLIRAGSRVTTYEGSEEMIAIAKQTIRIEGSMDAVEFNHAIVGDDIDMYGIPGTPELVPPGEIPDCDAVLLDCEGAEYSIIRDLTVTPRVMIVEVHPEKGRSFSRLQGLLTEKGYVTVETRPISPDDDRPVVIAKRNE